ncbi:TetR family transcriptional regulator [Rhizobiales bacterium RZME27]|uniref:TetR family transcriptional regulator n=1 Tax=Endobacterium cereale TaxID=2663029 RepID=A0A6A8A494_9HYPH|nr:TetR/AcrR family transcriptional regulator [Endobacterium cereale]MEB2848175.1 TetR/AcrR family transcriptional regulator [Endobacterium cereale]MQY46162.1 TetR family transcriptional regulator [Endobacterium cereale]
MRKDGKSGFTARGEATRLRIIEAAAEIVYAEGAAGMSLDEVMDASRTSKSQLYHYFCDKDALIQEVIGRQTRRIVEANAPHLDKLDSFDALRSWCNMIIEANRTFGAIGGCPLGSLASELSAQSEQARAGLANGFEAWRSIIAEGLARMKNQDKLMPSADTQALSMAFVAAIQGGILLSKTSRNSQPLEVALNMALSHIERYVVAPAER